ncbi:MAG TPA: cytochrome c oxidase subunit II [Burkholderiales bacterium]|nr:cytochrome c oxidase subunit II [Burkholderiales bacterium]
MNATGQSAFEPAGTHALAIDELSRVLYIGTAATFAVAVAIVAIAVLGRASRVSSRAWIVGGGLALPTLVLGVLLVYALRVGEALSMDVDCSVTVRIVAKRWWWEVRYVQPTGDVVSANELHLPANRRVKLLLETSDVIHSFWVPSLAGKVDMIPGRVNHLVVEASRPGVYRGQCAEYCGAQHALMALSVIVHDNADFERWLEKESRPAIADEEGARQFAMSGCAQCHTVRGTQAAGRDGPDLTHVASRATLAAGTLPMSRGALAGWIADSQGIKPGNLMPPTRTTPQALHALTEYVESLK